MLSINDYFITFVCGLLEQWMGGTLRPMPVETAPNISIVTLMLEDMVRESKLRTGILPKRIIDQRIAQIANDIFFRGRPLQNDLGIIEPETFREEVDQILLILSPTGDLSAEHMLVGPNIEKLVLFRHRLLNQGHLYFDVRRLNGETLRIPLGDGFSVLAARMIANQLENHDKSSKGPWEFRQLGHPQSPKNKNF